MLDQGDKSAILVLVEDADTGSAAADAILIVQWWRSCDSLSITSVPRDLVITPDGRPLAVVHANHGVSASSAEIARQFDIDVAATVTISVDDVAELSGRVGPVTVALPSASRDLRSGFSGGPGKVELVDDRAVSFLRSRHWETFDDSGWTLVDSTDRGRIERLHDYLEQSLALVRGMASTDVLELARAAVRQSEVVVEDPFALTGFAVGSADASRTIIDVVPTRAELAPDERQSPLEFDHLGARYRALVAPDFAGLPDHCALGEHR